MTDIRSGIDVRGQTGARTETSVDASMAEKRAGFDRAMEEAACHVEVRSKTIPATGHIGSHAYIVTRETGPRDPDGPPPYLGRTTAHRGGPGPRSEEREDGESPTKIITESAEYIPRESSDYPKPGERHQVIVVSSHKGDCDEVDRQMETAVDDIQREDHDYELVTRNSNSVAREILERTGEPTPDDPPGWTPGWRTDLPGTLTN